MIKTIKAGNVSAAIDSLGGQLLSLKKDDVEYVWQRDPEFWVNCAPLLFPVVGRLKNQVLTIKGKDYPMPKHGFALSSEMEMIGKTENSVTFRLIDNEKTKEFYPWSFCFDVTYTLTGNKLDTSFRVENRDKDEMLFGLGGHPGFRVPLSDDEAFTDFQLEFEKEERLESNHVNEDEAISATQKDLMLDGGRILPIRRDLFNNDAMIFEDIESKWVNLVSKNTGKGIHFSYEDFPILAIWTKGEPSEAPYVCLEPWFGMGFRDNETSDMENKYGVLRLAPGAVFTAGFSAEIID